MKKILSLVFTLVLLFSEVMPVWQFLDLEVPIASAAACTISANTDMTAAYVATCDGITVTSNATLTFFNESLNMNGSDVNFTINDSVDVTWSGTGNFTDATEDIIVNGTITHAASGSGVIIDAAGDVTIGATGSISLDGKGCDGGGDDTNGYGPNLSTGVCAITTSGYGDAVSGGASHGGLGGDTDNSNVGTTYGSQMTPIYLGSGGGGAGWTAEGGVGGGRLFMDVDGTLSVNGVITADGGNGTTTGPGAGGGGSGGSVYIIADTLAGSSSVSADGGNGANGSEQDGAGGGGGRVAVYFNTLSGFDLSGITVDKGVKVGSDTNPTEAYNGTTYILDQDSDHLYISDGLEFEDGEDYARADITIYSGAYLTCEAQTTLNLGASSNYTDNGSTWACSNTMTNLNISASGTITTAGVDWDITDTSNFNFSAVTWTTSGTNAVDFSKNGAVTEWDITNNLTLNNLTWTGPDHASTSSGSGALISLANAIDVALVNTDILASVYFDGLTSLNIDADSSISADDRGCPGGVSNNDGYGPNVSTGVCGQSVSGYGDFGSNSGGGAGYGGYGGNGDGSSTNSATYGSAIAPTLLGSGGAGGGWNANGGDGGGKIYLNINGTLTVDGAVSTDGGNADNGDGPAGGGGGSGGSLYIIVTTLDGSGSMTASGGNGGNGNTYDGGGAGGGRMAVYYTTNSGFDLSNITAVEGVITGSQESPGNGVNGTTFILDRKTDDGAGNLRVNSGLEFENGSDYERTTITIDDDAYLTCADQTTLIVRPDSGNLNLSNFNCDATITTLNVGTPGNLTIGGTGGLGGTIGTVNLSATGNVVMAGTWTSTASVSNLNVNAGSTFTASGSSWSDSGADNISITAPTFTTAGTSAIGFTDSGAQVDWDISNDLNLTNFTYTGGIAGTSSGTGGVLTLDNNINVTLVNTDINSSVYWDGITSLNVDSSSSINADEKGCQGGYNNGDGYGPNESTGVCGQGVTGFGDYSAVHPPSYGGGGAGYGGAGGDAGGTSVASATYGSASIPTLFGSGGAGAGWSANGGYGGGKIYLNVSGTITVSGTVSADAENGDNGGGVAGGGGGSGGSVYLLSSTLVGTGTVTAAAGNGGNGNTYDGGGGGGGRISFSYDDRSSWNPAVLNSALGSKGGTQNSPSNGSTGTIFYSLDMGSIVITDISGYSNDSTPEVTVSVEGTDDATHVAFSCNGGTNWSSWLSYPDDDVANDGDGPAFDMTTDATGCSTTEELKTITAKVKNAGEEPAGTASDTTTYDISAPSGLANLAVGDTTATTAVVTWTAASEATSFDHYELWYGADQSDVQGRTGTAVEWDTVDDADLGTVTTATTTLTGLTAGVTYYLKIWAIDTATNEATLSDITFNTNQDPTAASVSATPATDGSHQVTISFVADDPDDDDTLSAKVEYNVGGGWNPCTLESTTSATYGTPVIDNGETYQVGTAAGYITTSSGANTVTVTWDADNDVSSTDTSSAQIRVTPYDSIAEGSSASSSTFELDQVAPAGGLTGLTGTPADNSVSLTWDAITSETNFTNYKVYYKLQSDSSYLLAGTLSGMSTSSSSISGLSENTGYHVYIMATDDYGNTKNSPTMAITTTATYSEDPPFGETTGGGGGGGGSTSPPAGEEETGGEDYEAPIVTPEEETPVEETEITTEPEEATPTEPEVTEPAPTEPEVAEPEPETAPYVAPTAPTIEEEPTEPVEEQPVSVGTYDDGAVTEKIYEDEVVITFHDTSEPTAGEEPAASISVPIEEPEEPLSMYSFVMPGWTEGAVWIGGEEKPTTIEEADADGDGINDTWEEENLGSTATDGTADTDQDGLTDYEESLIGSDPTTADSDGDGLSDSEETAIGSDPSTSDSDQDGVPDNEDVPAAHIDYLFDTDRDGINDVWEEENFGSTDTDGTADTDNDGLTDYEESLVGSDPAVADSDGDGLNDKTESSLGTDPTNPDSDNDGVSDAADSVPVDDTAKIDLIDTDQDGMSDAWEETNFGDTTSDGTADTDNDGLTDYEEALVGSDPTTADSDGDGLSDSEETLIGTDPNNSDTDNDGTSDGADTTPAEDVEITRVDDPLYVSPDTDQDGMSDVWEEENFGSTAPDGTADTDNDGLTDYEESLVGTDPQSPDSDGDGVDDYTEVIIGQNPLGPEEVDVVEPEATPPETYDETIEIVVEEVKDEVKETEQTTDIEYETNPADVIEEALADSDQDGMLDVWEEEYFGDTDTDGTQDTDGDGLSDAAESQTGSDPLDADSDNDGISDFTESLVGTDPGSWDSDSDGISDTDELFAGTDPTAKETKEIDTTQYDEQVDSDGDGLSDYMEEYYNTDPNNPDTDNDGITDSDELVYDFDPNSTDYVEEIDTRVTNISATSNSPEVTIQGTSDPGATVIIYVFDGEANIAEVIETTSDEGGKFTTAVTKDLEDGDYSIFITSVDEKNQVDQISPLEHFSVDSTLEAPSINITEFDGASIGLLGSKMQTDNRRPSVKAVTDPGAIVYVSWKSLIFTSVVVADSQGEVTVQPPQELEEAEHIAYLYAEDPTTSVTGATSQINFTVATDVFFHESAAQQEAQDRFPYTTLILIALIALAAGYIIYKKSKQERSKEDEMIEKL